MLVSHRLTRGLCRVCSLRRHLGNWQARVQRVHRAGPSKRTPWLPLPGRRSTTRRSIQLQPLLLQSQHTPHSRGAPNSRSLRLRPSPGPAPPRRISVGQSCGKPSAVVSPLIVAALDLLTLHLGVFSPLAEPTVKPEFSHEMVAPKLRAIS